ncbi:MAG: DUF2961 domain-containing protein [Planctomycetes bacterium]|nr:DUF2961 domain-containing protein [Planctomycetota bacterium]
MTLSDPIPRGPLAARVVAGLGLPALLLAPLAAQAPLAGPSDRFSDMFPARSKTFIKASSDPDERPQAPSRGNDDGFTGTNQCEAFREWQGSNELAVLADVQGRAGYMGLLFRNFWSGVIGYGPATWESNRTQIVVDGLVRHDQPLADYFRNVNDPSGQIAPFDGPFTASRSGGHVTHTPIVWQQSFRVQSFENSFANAARFHKVAGCLMSPEELLQPPDKQAWETVYSRIGGWRHNAPRVLRSRQLVLRGDRIPREILIEGPATILELRCRVGIAADWEHLWARFYWDDERQPSVDLPLRLLVGRTKPPFSRPLDTLMFGNDGNREIWCYFPMHFTGSGRLVFENRGPTDIALDVDYAVHDGPHPGNWGYFTATYQRAVTQTGVTFRGPHLTNCRGMLRGLFLETQADTTGRIGYGLDLGHLEGDLCVRINGNRGDEHNFAATETSVGKWGWYGTPSDVPFRTDTSFQTGFMVRTRPDAHLESDRVQGSTFVFDPIHFVDGIEIALEHGVQNLSNADYGLVSIFYLQRGAARELVDELDVGDSTDESRLGVQFGTAPVFLLTSPFFRDQFFGTPPLTDEGRDVQDWYRFTVSDPRLAGYRGVCLEFRLDRQRVGNGGIAQADVLVNGMPAGLLHSWTSNERNRWKEGGELEVELPRTLTDGLTSLQIEVRHVVGTEPLRIGAIRVHGYTQD